MRRGRAGNDTNRRRLDLRNEGLALRVGHTDEVLRRRLGMNPDEVAGLRARGTV
jgi:hypothetical protein